MNEAKNALYGEIINEMKEFGIAELQQTLTLVRGIKIGESIAKDTKDKK